MTEDSIFSNVQNHADDMVQLVISKEVAFLFGKIDIIFRSKRKNQVFDGKITQIYRYETCNQLATNLQLTCNRTEFRIPVYPVLTC